MLSADEETALREAQNSDPDLMEKLVFYFDGEKDPRNLMIVFSVLLVPMTEWDISTHAQVCQHFHWIAYWVDHKSPPLVACLFGYRTIQFP